MLELEVRIRNGIWRKTEKVKEVVRKFLITENGDTNFISIILILVLVLGLAAIFREKIGEFVTKWWATIMEKGNAASKDWEVK